MVVSWWIVAIGSLPIRIVVVDKQVLALLDTIPMGVLFRNLSECDAREQL
jgi:hypothetical protein